MAEQRTAFTSSLFSVTVHGVVEQALSPNKQRSLKEIISNVQRWHTVRAALMHAVSPNRFHHMMPALAAALNSNPCPHLPFQSKHSEQRQ